MEPQQEPEIIIEKWYQKKKFLYILGAIVIIVAILFVIRALTKPTYEEQLEQRRQDTLSKLNIPAEGDERQYSEEELEIIRQELKEGIDLDEIIPREDTIQFLTQ